MYVDNLIQTGNSFKELHDLYKESVIRMQEGNFNLRPWNSNNSELRKVMIENKKFVEHSSNFEKVLYYHYNTNLNYFKISNDSVDRTVKTKRGVLSQLYRVFDPLSFTMPITVRGKFLIKQLWTKKFSWDQEIDKDDRKDWLSLSDDLNKLDKLQFSRNIVNTESPCDI